MSLIQKTWSKALRVGEDSDTITDPATGVEEITQYGYDESSLSSGNGTAPGWNANRPSGSPRGNLTSEQKYLNTTGTYLTTTLTYNDTGTVASLKLPANAPYPDTTTTYGYSSAYQGGLLTSMTNAMGQTESYSYDASSSLLTQITDVNHNNTNYYYYPDARPKQVVYPLTAAGDPETDYSYPSSVEIEKVEKQDTSTSVATETMFDGLGRNIETLLLNGCPGGDSIETDTLYDLDSQVAEVSNPHCTSSQFASDGWTIHGTGSVQGGNFVDGYDALGRPTVVTMPDLATQSWSYTDDTASFTNEDGAVWARTKDALGRLVQVTEPGALNTTYGYDAFGNLLSVNQTGNILAGEAARLRSFTYDSLSRLVTATDPEAGTICYGTVPGGSAYLPPPIGGGGGGSGGSGGTGGGGTCVGGYDAHGNLIAKTDARGIATTYSYDALNRIRTKSYSDGTTPSASFAYDETGDWGAANCAASGLVQCNTVGRLSSMSTSDGLTGSVFSYDTMGRKTEDATCTDTRCASASSHAIYHSYSYDLAGNETGYDHGTDVNNPTAPFGGYTQTYDGVGRLLALQTQPTSGTPMPLFSASSYSPVGLSGSTLGNNNLNELRGYDNRARQVSYNVVNPVPPSNWSMNGWIGSVYNTDETRFPGYSAPPCVQSNGTAAGVCVPENGSISITGWAATAQSCPVAAVEIDVDQTAIGYATLGGTFGGVETYYNDDGQHNYCGFVFTGSIGGASAGLHNVTAYMLDANGDRSLVGPGATTMVVSSDSPPVGYMDPNFPWPSTIVSGGLVHVSGWAIDSQMHAPVGAIKILVDGVAIGYATLGVSRPDVAAYKNDSRYTNSGWIFTGSIGNIAPGSHTVSAVIYDNGGQQYAITEQPNITLLADNAIGVNGNVDVVINPSNSSLTIPANGTVYVKGWAGQVQDETNCATDISRVDVLVDGMYLGQAQLGAIPRPDVATYFSNTSCANAGWQFTGTLSNIDPGQHMITARAYDSATGSYILPGDIAITLNGTISSVNVASTTPTQYSWALGYDPAGNVAFAYDSVNGNYAYLYDSLNRLVAAGSNNASFQWNYDSFGNRLAQVLTGGSGTTAGALFPTPDNRPYGVSFDASGNALNDGTGFGPALTYDAEDRLSSAGSTHYLYDAMGQRVAKYNAGALTNVYLYDEAGNVITELNGSFAVTRREVYAGGRHLGTYDQNGVLSYSLTDWIGTERARADSTGVLCETSTSQPFGDNEQSSGTCFPSPKFFTGKERDAESGLDYFGARYYASSAGRWMSPDWSAKEEPVPYAKLDNPQSLNLYAYVGNNPLSQADSDGHDGSCLVQEATEVATGVGEAGVVITLGDVIATGAVIYGGYKAVESLVNPPVVISADLPMDANGKPIIPASSTAQEDKPAPPEPKTDGAGARSGGGRNGQKANADRVQSAKDKITDLKGQRDKLASQANKTPADKKKLKKLDNQIKQQQDRMKPSENHSQKGKGQ
jgi:RHS repeat-associated protein